jgi:hypothetical protein
MYPFSEESLSNALKTLGWDLDSDDIAIEVGGTQVSGIDVGEEYNKKWQSPIGTRKYNKDAFLVIKNLSRNKWEPSLSMQREFKPHHLKESNLDKQLDDEFGYDTYSK